MGALGMAAFGRPIGLLGRIGGALMARQGAATERFVLHRLAAPAPADTVLVLGPGPGVGLAAAAARTPDGLVIGVEPSAVLRGAARRRCAAAVADGRVLLRDGSAAETGQPDSSVDVVISVNNVHLWGDRAAAFTEVHRVLRPGGRLVVSVHDAVLPGRREELRSEAAVAGFAGTRITARPRPGDPLGSAIELTAQRPTGPRTTTVPIRDSVHIGR